MTAQDFRGAATRSAPRRRAEIRRNHLRYRLAVVAGTAADVVRHAGGWLCDRTMAGWEVTVVLADPRDADAVEILGASVLDLDTSLGAAVHDPWPHALAVATDLFTADPRVRAGLLDCLDNGRAEVVMWGEVVPSSLDDRLDTVHHRISVAAQTFKDCALAAVGLPVVAGETSEQFRCGELLVTGAWGATDLVSIG